MRGQPEIFAAWGFLLGAGALPALNIAWRSIISTLPPSPAGEGDSAVDKWAYATGTRQVDERTGRIYDHTCKASEILATGKVD